MIFFFLFSFFSVSYISYSFSFGTTLTNFTAQVYGYRVIYLSGVILFQGLLIGYHFAILLLASLHSYHGRFLHTHGISIYPHLSFGCPSSTKTYSFLFLFLSFLPCDMPFRNVCLTHHILFFLLFSSPSFALLMSLKHYYSVFSHWSRFRSDYLLGMKEFQGGASSDDNRVVHSFSAIRNVGYYLLHVRRFHCLFTSVVYINLL